MSTRSDYRTPLSRVEGLGAGHTGTTHFLRQRISAVALLFLSVWFVVSALGLVSANLAEVLVFFGQPLHAVPMFLFLAAATYHMSLGLQTIIEDYVHQEGLKFICLMLNRFFMWGVGVSAGLALLKMAV
jgi:succinate dehydrogenase / fumarate reductase membrane anchor subunit